MYKVGDHKPGPIQQSQMHWEILKALLPILPDPGERGTSREEIAYYLQLSQEFVLEFIDFNWGDTKKTLTEQERDLEIEEVSNAKL